MGNIGPLIMIPDSQSKSQANIQIPSKCILARYNTFGHYKAPAGNAVKQLLLLRKKSNKLGQQVSIKPFKKTDSSTLYLSIYLPSMG
jgi:hypothetical protein